jgi:exodeoxyribonuclease VII small subunit
LEKKEKKQQKKITFEEALTELETIASQLEEGTLGLDDSITRFEKGIELARFCREKLEEAERKIEILQKGGSGNVKKKEVRVKEDTGEIEDDEDVQGSLL